MWFTRFRCPIVRGGPRPPPPPPPPPPLVLRPLSRPSLRGNRYLYFLPPEDHGDATDPCRFIAHLFSRVHRIETGKREGRGKNVDQTTPQRLECNKWDEKSVRSPLSDPYGHKKAIPLEKLCCTSWWRRKKVLFLRCFFLYVCILHVI